MSTEGAESMADGLAAYDAGLLNDYGGGNVDWWWDYIRSELERAHEHYVSQFLAERPCTCHPDDRPEGLCPKRYAASECLAENRAEALRPAPERPARQWIPDDTLLGELGKSGHWEPVARPASMAADEGLAGRIKKLRDGYASQAKFADAEPAAWFREFVQRVDAALAASPPRDAPKVYHYGAALQGIADEHAGVLTPRQVVALYRAAGLLWDVPADPIKGAPTDAD